jgi:hypothetical protein
MSGSRPLHRWRRAKEADSCSFWMSMGSTVSRLEHVGKDGFERWPVVIPTPFQDTCFPALPIVFLCLSGAMGFLEIFSTITPKSIEHCYFCIAWILVGSSFSVSFGGYYYITLYNHNNNAAYVYNIVIYIYIYIVIIYNIYIYLQLLTTINQILTIYVVFPCFSGTELA